MTGMLHYDNLSKVNDEDTPNNLVIEDTEDLWRFIPWELMEDGFDFV